MIPKRLLSVLVAILPLATPDLLQAGEKEAADPQTIDFSCVAMGNLPFPELFYRGGKEYLPIKLSSGQRSQVYRLQDANALELFVQNEKAADDGKSASSDSYKLVGLAPLLEGAVRMLFLIEPANESDKNSSGLPLQIRGLDDSLETFPAGSFRFINLTPDLLRIEFGGATHDLSGGDEKVLSSNISATGGFLPVIIKNEEGRTVLENRLFGQSNGRELVILSPPDEGRKGLKVTFLSDIIPASPSPGKKSPLSK